MSSDENTRLEIIDSVIPGVTIESNVPQLAEQLFSKPASEPGTVLLQLETDDVADRSPEQAQTIFEILAHLLLYGVKVKYGQDQDPRKLTKIQLDTLNKYMQSFGFNVVLNSYHIDETMDDPENYKPTDIEFYRLRMIDPDVGLWHDIKIESYKPQMILSHPGRLL